MVNVVWKETHMTVKYIVLLFNTVKVPKGPANLEHGIQQSKLFSLNKI